MIPGEYDVVTTFGAERVNHSGGSWFRVNSGFIKAESTHSRRISALVAHSGVIDWEATFYFLRLDLHKRIDAKFNSI